MRQWQARRQLPPGSSAEQSLWQIAWMEVHHVALKRIDAAAQELAAAVKSPAVPESGSCCRPKIFAFVGQQCPVDC